MISQQNLYFPHFDIKLLVVLSFVILISIGLVAVILIRKQKMNNRLKIILLSISFIFGGVILGGVPNVVLIIQHIFADIFLPNLWFSLLIRISIFLGLIFIFGRIFCGYICPLGAIQEIASINRFKTKLDYKRKYKKRKNVLRWVFFGIYAVISIIWGLELSLFMNPINGFLIFWIPLDTLILVAFILFTVIVLISFFIYRPYCRFFCPFGALACLLGRITPLKMRRTLACNDCGICEKICPTFEGFKFSTKGECYLCYRCVSFCSNEMFIDNQKIAQIKRLLSTYSLNFNMISKEKYLDKTLKSIIRLFVPYKRKRYFERLFDAIEGKKDFPLEIIQNLITRLKEIFPDEIKQLERLKFKEWIEQNELKWKKKIEPIHLDKLTYGLAKKAEELS